MALLILLILILLVFGLIVLLPLLIKRLNQTDKRLKFLILIPFIGIGYFVYTAIYPSDDFFKENFKEVTGMKFPDNGEILYKTTGYPDQSGDYGSVSIIKVDKKFYDELPGHLEKKGLMKTCESHGSIELDEVITKIGDKKIEKEFSFDDGKGIYYYVAFLSDKKSLIINRQSW